jgi:hypothetical protein
VNSLKSTHWACGDHMGVHFLKEPLMGGLGSWMGTLQGKLWTNSKVSFTKYLLGTLGSEL